MRLAAPLEWCAPGGTAGKPGSGCAGWRELGDDLPAGPGPIWLRARLKVEPDLEDRALGLRVLHRGAVAVFVDGELRASIGVVGSDASSEEARVHRGWILFVLPSATGPSHELAFLASSFLLEDPWLRTLEPRFELEIRLPTVASPELAPPSRSRARAFLVGLLLAFAFVHGLLWAFDRRDLENLHFSLLAAWGAVAVEALDRLGSWTGYRELLVLLGVFRLGIVALTLSLVAFVQRFTGVHRPRALAVFAIAGAGAYAAALRWPFGGPGGVDLVLLLSLAAIPETVWCFRRSRRSTPGRRLVEVGAIPLLLTGLAQILVLVGVLAEPPPLLADPFGAIALLMLAMSILLAYRFADRGRRLEAELREVERLSAERLRDAVERAGLEADNRRKTAELEEARRLQLSMLPRRAPSSERWLMLARMETAVEVGGDYYDFLEEGGGEVTAVLGDATGHGLQAGILVAATKALVGAHAGRGPGSMLEGISGQLRAMRLRRRLMSLAVLRLEASGGLRLAAAGMPPFFLRRADGAVEELAPVGVPLGALAGQRYEEHRVTVGPGDLVVGMTDGLPESRDVDGELLGYRRVEDAIRDGPAGPEALIAHLEELGRSWRGGPPEDDQTLLVVRRLPELPTDSDEEHPDAE